MQHGQIAKIHDFWLTAPTLNAHEDGEEAHDATPLDDVRWITLDSTEPGGIHRTYTSPLVIDAPVAASSNALAGGTGGATEIVIGSVVNPACPERSAYPRADDLRVGAQIAIETRIARGIAAQQRAAIEAAPNAPTARGPPVSFRPSIAGPASVAAQWLTPPGTPRQRSF